MEIDSESFRDASDGTSLSLTIPAVSTHSDQHTLDSSSQDISERRLCVKDVFRPVSYDECHVLSESSCDILALQSPPGCSENSGSGIRGLNEIYDVTNKQEMQYQPSTLVPEPGREDKV